jgi:hypothetical protein
MDLSNIDVDKLRTNLALLAVGYVTIWLAAVGLIAFFSRGRETAAATADPVK